MDMRGDSEEAAFRNFKATPSPDRLAALLTSVQDRVYNICFQILRRTQDAEDACQEVLIELTRGLHSVPEPRPFKVWLYRVAVHTALDRKDATARQAGLARRAPTSKPEDPSMNEAERAELMRAIRTLDDRTRCMVLEHYFDKLTLEEIAAREGVSAVAVWKRLDRAKEALRRALLGAGLATAAAGVAQSLEAVTPVAVPAGFMGKAALIAAGGAAVGTKSAVSAGTIVAAILLAGAASTGGYLAANSRASGRIKAMEERLASLQDGRNPAAPPVKWIQPPPVVLPPAANTKEETKTRTNAEAATFPVIDHSTVKYGRPPKSSQDDLHDAKTWDQFYRIAQELKLRAEPLEDLIFKRVATELRLEVDAAEILRKLFEEERKAATQAIVEAGGGPNSFERKQEEQGMNWKVLYPEWQRLRETVRLNYNAEYMKHLTYDQLQYFNEHLRNDKIGLETSHGPEGTYYLVTGVGMTPESE